jgi:hypothetical protein
MATVFKMNEKTEAESILKQITAYVKKQCPGHKDINLYKIGNVWHIDVESPLQLSDDMETIVNKTKHGYVQHRSETPGQYDWASDTYIRDCSSVAFILKP